MSDIVKRLRAPAYWISGSSEGHEGDNSAPAEAADRIEQLEEANELMLTDIRRTDVDMLAFKTRIEQLESALREIDQQRYTRRNTINLDNAYEMAIALNVKLLAVMDTARAALEERT